MRGRGRPRSLAVLLDSLGIPFRVAGPDARGSFRGIDPPGSGTAESLVFVLRYGTDALSGFLDGPARLAVAPAAPGRKEARALAASGKTCFLVAQPRLALARLLAALHPEEDAWPPGIHPTAIVSPRARLHRSVRVGPCAVLGACTIGEGSRIGAHSVIGDGVVIGRDVTVREHCVLGGPGFGMVRDEETGRVHRMPHLGRTVIEDDVQIFPFANVDRGTLGDTLIRRGAMVDHYVHVSHNCTVGEDAILTAGTILCGKSRAGARSWFGVGTRVKEGVLVGEDSVTGLGAVVLRDVPPRTTVVGVPAEPLGPGRRRRSR